jgi:hypothetical protein
MFRGAIIIPESTSTFQRQQNQQNLHLRLQQQQKSQASKVEMNECSEDNIIVAVQQQQQQQQHNSSSNTDGEEKGASLSSYLNSKSFDELKQLALEKGYLPDDLPHYPSKPNMQKLHDMLRQSVAANRFRTGWYGGMYTSIMHTHTHTHTRHKIKHTMNDTHAH